MYRTYTPWFNCGSAFHRVFLFFSLTASNWAWASSAMACAWNWMMDWVLWQPTLEVCTVYYWPRFELVLLSEHLSLDGTHPMLPWEQGISTLKLKWACNAFFPALFSAITTLWLPCKEYPSVSTFVAEIVSLVTDSYWSLNFLIQGSAFSEVWRSWCGFLMISNLVCLCTSFWFAFCSEVFCNV
jgi:hypothetical protein